MKSKSMWYFNMPIRSKLLLWMVPLLLVTIALTGGVSYLIASDQVLRKISQSQDDLTKKSIDQFNYIAQDAIDFTNFLFLSANVQELLSSDDPAVRQRTFSSLSTLMVTRQSIHSAILYKLNKNEETKPLAINQTGITSVIAFDEFKKTEFFKKALEKNGEASWSFLGAEQKLFVGDKQHKIILTKVIKNINSLKPLGIVVVGINEEKLRSDYMKMIGSDAQMFFVDQEGTVLTATDPLWLGKRFAELPFIQSTSYADIQSLPKRLNTDKWIISHAMSDLTGWHAIVIQPKQQLLEELDRIGFLMATLIGICFILSILVSWFIASILTNPLKILIRSMRRLQTGDFSQRVGFTGNDEIGQVGHGYDHMVQRIKQLIDDVYSSRLKQREAELKTLQAQIHPHFLYNTLDTICWTAQKRGQKDIADLVYSLSQVFRLSLNDGKDMITLEQELELIKNYLFLQQTRFQSRFTFAIEMDPSVKHILIPKLLLQPIVENAVIHGIEPFEGNGIVRISAYPKNNGVQIDIIDNGTGMSEQQLKKIEKMLIPTKVETFNAHSNAHTKETGGFALMNIKERLSMAFGSEGKLELESQTGKGTAVCLFIPLRKERGDD
jgi:two-component system sensor histidine kinase YesM